MMAKPAISTASDAESVAGLRLLSTYAGLAERGEHLLDSLLGGQPPKQWAHYPDDDAFDREHGYQWFYHSHSPEDRPDAAEHGHIHLFARRNLWSRRLRSAREVSFAELEGGPKTPVNTRHLLTIGFDAKGLPVSLFTVNSWVTGDLMLSAETTAQLLEDMTLESGHNDVDAVIESVARLCYTEIRGVLVQRDRVLRDFAGKSVLADESLELLSESTIDVDAKLRALGVLWPQAADRSSKFAHSPPNARIDTESGRRPPQQNTRSTPSR